jgi:hypothetical protein
MARAQAKKRGVRALLSGGRTFKTERRIRPLFYTAALLSSYEWGVSAALIISRGRGLIAGGGRDGRGTLSAPD